MSKPRRITYLVSGDENIELSYKALRRTGRTVSHDTEVDRTARRALKEGRRYVVVAHGSADGTVSWYRTDDAESFKWLWVGMSHVPKGARVYLYSCRAGRLLPRFLKHCDCLGHVDVVPMPREGKRDVVTKFLDEVDKIMRAPSFDPEQGRQRLAKYVNDEIVREVEKPSGILSIHYLKLLRASLGNIDV